MRLHSARFKDIRLGQKLGQGGEAAVYIVDGHPGLAAKLYDPPKSPDYVGKLVALMALADASLLQLAAMPIDTLHDPTGRVVGFLMHRLSGHSPAFKLYGPKLRLQAFPKADWRFLIHAAANVARAFARIHASGLVIGDVNHGNLFVGQDATAHLIDCDSFQVRNGAQTWFCEVGVGTHQPPEMQGLQQGYKGVLRTPDHDAFGLAVLIFQLLCMGRHPFQGAYRGAGEAPQIEDAIARSWYAYTQDTGRSLLGPPSASLPMDALTPGLRDLFESAFSPSAATGGRPAPERWVTELSGLSGQLRQCRSNAAHHHLARLLNCPWCAIETSIGASLFPVVFINRPGLPGGMAVLWQEAERLAEPLPLPPLPDPVTFLPRVQRSTSTWERASWAAIAAATLAAIVLTRLPFQVTALLGVALGFAPRLIKSAGLTPEQHRLTEIGKDWEGLAQAWRAPLLPPRWMEEKREIALRKAEHDTLATQRAQQL